MATKSSNPTISDQPTSSAKDTDDKQEWWVEQDVDGYWHIGLGNRGFADLGKGTEAEVTAKAIKFAHNAALAAGKKETTRWVIEAHESAKELFAERQRRELDERVWRGRYNDVWQQLLCGQAVIEKHNKAHLPKLRIHDVDLSALHQHDEEVSAKAWNEGWGEGAAEARKPLVDALEKYMIAMDGLYNHNAATRKAVVQHFGTVHPSTAIVALAKVKE